MSVKILKMYPLSIPVFFLRVKNIECSQTYLYRSHMMPSYLKEVLDFLVLWLSELKLQVLLPLSLLNLNVYFSRIGQEKSIWAERIFSLRIQGNFFGRVSTKSIYFRDVGVGSFKNSKAPGFFNVPAYNSKLALILKLNTLGAWDSVMRPWVHWEKTVVL